MNYTREAILRRNKVFVKAKKLRKDRWIYHYDNKDNVVAVKLYGVEKLIGKVVRSASKVNNPDRTWYFVKPIFAFGKIDAVKNRWFADDKVRTICTPKGAKNCDDCSFRFACWTVR